jgi:hypothetical protein
MAGMFAAGGLFAACSNNPGTGDGGLDSGGSDSTSDSPSTNDGGGNKDTGSDGQQVTCEAGVPGTCDIVAQNCPSGQECDPEQLDGGTWDLHCTSNTTGNITEGYACTAGSSNPCVAGLECISGRCAKHCCFGNDSMCGTAHPEGFQGKCDLTVTLGTTPGYTVCAYNSACEPFDIQPCGTGQTCLVTDVNGTSSCSMLNGTGYAEKHACMYANDCAPGLGCYGSLDGGASNCQWNCYVPPGPYDAGIASLPAGQGGCNTPEKCQPINWGGMLPTWLGICQ